MEVLKRCRSGAADSSCNREMVLHSFATFAQLALSERGMLRAPEGEHDDRADSYALALTTAVKARQETFEADVESDVLSKKYPGLR